MTVGWVFDRTQSAHECSPQPHTHTVQHKLPRPIRGEWHHPLAGINTAISILIMLSCVQLHVFFEFTIVLM